MVGKGEEGSVSTWREIGVVTMSTGCWETTEPVPMDPFGSRGREGD